jgi:hypothetical protein
MKKIKYLLILVVAVMVSVSCSNDDGDDDVNALVGTWEFTEFDDGDEITVTVTFKANYTGTIVAVVTFDGESETENDGFTWDTDGNKLTMEVDGETDISTYSISGDKLTINFDDGETIVLTRQ